MNPRRGQTKVGANIRPFSSKHRYDNASRLLSVTNAAGLSNTTNLFVVKNDMTLALTSINGDLWNATVDVGGTISDPAYSVWVNGVQGTNNGNGTWNAASVPVSTSGVASFDVSASLGGGDPDYSTNVIKDAEVRIVAYHETKNESSTNAEYGESFALTRTMDYASVFGTNGAGQWSLQSYVETVEDNQTHWFYYYPLEDLAEESDYVWSSTNAAVFYDHYRNSVGYDFKYTNGTYGNPFLLPDIDLYEFGSDGGNPSHPRD